MKPGILALSLIALLAAPRPGHADVLTFSYTAADNGVVSGVLDGTLEADGITFRVSSALSAAYDGTPGPALPYVDSADNALLTQPGTPATVSLDGSFMDLVACTDQSCSNEILFARGDAYAAAFGSFTFATGPDFGNYNEPFSSGQFVASVVRTAAVPEPWSVTLLGCGLGTLSLTRRRRG